MIRQCFVGIVREDVRWSRSEDWNTRAKDQVGRKLSSQVQASAQVALTKLYNCLALRFSNLTTWRVVTLHFQYWFIHPWQSALIPRMGCVCSHISYAYKWMCSYQRQKGLCLSSTPVEIDPHVALMSHLYQSCIVDPMSMAFCRPHVSGCWPGVHPKCTNTLISDYKHSQQRHTWTAENFVLPIMSTSYRTIRNIISMLWCCTACIHTPLSPELLDTVCGRTCLSFWHPAWAVTTFLWIAL